MTADLPGARDTTPEDWWLMYERNRAMNLTLTGQAAGGGVAVVTVAGEVDVYTGGELRRILADLGGSGQHRVVVDLTACTFLDCTGLAAITVGVVRARASGGEVMIAATDEPILRVFRVTGLTRLLRICGTAADAVSAQRASAAPPADAPG